MRIQIITVYKSKNYGSYLQAKGLAEQLSNYGQVKFLDTKIRRLSVADFLRDTKKSFLKRKNKIAAVKEIIFNTHEFLNYIRLWNALPHTTDSLADVSVLGSDEIWNIRRETLISPVFWGEGIDSYKIAYAPSVNNSSSEDFEANNKCIDLLKTIDCISVRDNKSKEVLLPFLDRNIDVVLDPTLLTTPNNYDFKFRKPYIAVYLFEANITDADITNIKALAQKEDLDIVGAGLYFEWCDYCIHSKNGNPFFIYENAIYVITNTFHGTAYAINYQKNFVAIIHNNDKILSLLKEFDLTERCVNSGEDCSSVLHRPFDNSHIKKLLEEKREKSIDFIQSSFNNHTSRRSI